MAEWKCAMCGWKNASSWQKCAKCGTEKIELTNNDATNTIIKRLSPEIDRLRVEIELYKINNSTKWEYLHLTSEDLNKEGGLSQIGKKGWELVSVSTYSEGATVMGSGLYSIKALYVFKRPAIKLPDEIIQEVNYLKDQFPPEARQHFFKLTNLNL